MKKYKTPVLFIDGTVDKMAICEIETEDDGTPLKVTIIRSTGVYDNPWTSVNDRLPEHDPKYGEKISIDVEAKFADGHTEKPCWCNRADREWERYGRPLEFRTDVTHWRYIKEDTNA